MQASDHELITICRVCIDRLESPYPFSSDSNGPHTEAPTATAAASAIDPNATCACDAVIVSTLATNMAQKQKMGEQLKPSNSTRLQGFCINGVLLPMTKVTQGSLMKWAIGKGRSKSKTQQAGAFLRSHRGLEGGSRHRNSKWHCRDF